MSGVMRIAAARMPRGKRALRLGDRVACALFEIDGCLEYCRGRVDAFSTKGRLVIRFDRFKDRYSIEADCVALDGDAP
jgi:hypothetical protein